VSTTAPGRPPLLVRLGYAAGGAVLLIPAVLLFWLPEIALPLAINALGLLAHQFRWAADAQASLVLRSAEGGARFFALPWWGRLAVSIAFGIVAIAIIVLVVGR
jgi:hypothetical protein